MSQTCSWSSPPYLHGQQLHRTGARRDALEPHSPHSQCCLLPLPSKSHQDLATSCHLYSCNPGPHQHRHSPQLKQQPPKWSTPCCLCPQGHSRTQNQTDHDKFKCQINSHFSSDPFNGFSLILTPMSYCWLVKPYTIKKPCELQTLSSTFPLPHSD